MSLEIYIHPTMAMNSVFLKMLYVICSLTLIKVKVDHN